MDDPVITFDHDTQVVTIDGYKFSRELFAHFTASPLGEGFRIVQRKDGCISITKERDERGAELLAAAKAVTAEFSQTCPIGPSAQKRLHAAIKAAEGDA